MVLKRAKNLTDGRRMKTTRAAIFACALPLLGSAIMGCPKAQTSAPPQESKPVVVDVEKTVPEPRYTELKRTKKEKMDASSGEGYMEMKRKSKDKKKADADMLYRLFNESNSIVEEANDQVSQELKKQP